MISNIKTWAWNNLMYLVIAAFMIPVFSVAVYGMYDSYENPTVYVFKEGIVIDIRDTWHGRVVVVELDNGGRTDDYCKRCIIGDNVTATFFDSDHVMSIRLR